LITLACVFLATSPAGAVRPFITDDARVVGDRSGQIETWFRLDNHALQQWVLPAFGPTSWLELALGGLHGFTFVRDDVVAYSIAGPLMQAKFLLHETLPMRWPGIALVAGLQPPVGLRSFATPDWSTPAASQPSSHAAAASEAT
jgi:hypothetical protein